MAGRQNVLRLSGIPLQAIEAFCRRHRIRRLSLFGSAVRGDFGPESDIDVLVEFEPDARVGFLQLSRMQRELAEIFHRPVDLVPRPGLKPLIREEILKEEVVLYAS
ncbi:nucleotidyltransferase family protein [Candidatus Caldatribacterium saccharofermentans]|uniref:Nucleotidyltransferase n=1 Tax=Candidatus Caldatribacterium saccharofermentans TaxID=1454753 RepID=A0A7V4TG57_9BACT